MIQGPIDTNFHLEFDNDLMPHIAPKTGNLYAQPKKLPNTAHAQPAPATPKIKAVIRKSKISSTQVELLM